MLLETPATLILTLKLSLLPDRDVMDGRDVVAVLVLEEHPEVVGV